MAQTLPENTKRFQYSQEIDHIKSPTQIIFLDHTQTNQNYLH